MKQTLRPKSRCSAIDRPTHERIFDKRWHLSVYAPLVDDLSSYKCPIGAAVKSLGVPEVEMDSEFARVKGLGSKAIENLQCAQVDGGRGPVP